MRQRVMIAMAMVCEPRVLIADEPTTALDVTIQAQILALMSRLQKDTGMSMLFITHNLGVVAHHAERVAVMYAGQVVEQAGVHELFAKPAHPYTQGLLACLPGRARQQARQSGQAVALQDIPGQAPAMNRLGSGCSFAERCSVDRPVVEPFRPEFLGHGEEHDGIPPAGVVRVDDHRLPGEIGSVGLFANAAEQTQGVELAPHRTPNVDHKPVVEHPRERRKLLPPLVVPGGRGVAVHGCLRAPLKPRRGPGMTQGRSAR
jgi:oligopeptide/dipeptide ABC transporter ATP-binding protein